MSQQAGQGDDVDAFPNLSKYKSALTQANPQPLLIKEERYSSLSDEDFEYNMRHKSRGVAVIINNMMFAPSTGMGPRNGSDVDRDNLIKTFNFLGFKDNIIIKENMTWRNMLVFLTRVAQMDYTNSDCVMVAILSHGDEDHIYGVDGPVRIESLLQPFKEKGSESLIGKPKIFLLQACRGEKLDAGHEYQTDDGEKEQKMYKIAKESDFLIAYSVVPGYYSWRNTSNGSWFVQGFCEVLKIDGRRLEFVQCLTRVNRMVSYTFESNARPEYMSMKKQSPCITSMLTKSLYF